MLGVPVHSRQSIGGGTPARVGSERWLAVAGGTPWGFFDYGPVAPVIPIVLADVILPRFGPTPACFLPGRRGQQGRSPKEAQIKFDWITALLFVLLAATVLAFVFNVFPYPYGFIVLTILLVGRLLAIRR